MEPLLIVWLVIIVACVVIELATVGLTTIWFACGAGVAMIIYGCKLAFGWQLAGFVIVSLIMLFFTRPFALKYINRKTFKSNVEGAIGKSVMITETVDAQKGTGKGTLDGMEWTVRSKDAKVTYEPGEEVQVAQVSGVKLIVEKRK
ncbi:NfeD family protein [Eubacterium oxidoreducens]|uniref:Membrane protein implicated in regulation of membrane protease activity n=1 Tax=Eubacterium oxidoreducens TaxID=1732 RepID=A0A1G5ZZP4_EUBOX|nr:NfeD family protein [Eubacterium oxidoreducens]SDB01688.1 Membrane protein implicated in regulation of membrane protease activity [Eubacterium oxidoreducens]